MKLSEPMNAPRTLTPVVQMFTDGGRAAAREVGMPPWLKTSV
jgi:hypothetical protein